MKVLYLWWQFYYKGYNSGTGKYKKKRRKGVVMMWVEMGIVWRILWTCHSSSTWICSPVWKLPPDLIILSFLKSRFHYLGMVKSLTIGSWTQSPTLKFICGILQGTLPHKSFKIVVKSYLNNSRNTVSYVGLCVTKICFFFASARESNYRGFD